MLLTNPPEAPHSRKGDCNRWTKKGQCVFGDKCYFQHGPAKKGEKPTQRRTAEEDAAGEAIHPHQDLVVNRPTHFSDHAYALLEKWITLALSSRQMTYESLEEKIVLVDDHLLEFLRSINLQGAWGSIISAPSVNHFEKQFHRWFDALSIFKLSSFLVT